MRLHGIAWILPVLLSSLAVPAHGTRWDAYTTADGLPSLEVWDIVQAGDGHVWAATRGGLARIDRRVPLARWQTVSPQFFRVLAVDTRGVIWAGGDAGRLAWFSEDGMPMQTPALVPGGTNVHALYAATDGRVWIGETDSLRSWHPTSGTRAWPALRGPVVDIDRAPSGRLWLALGRCVPSGNIRSGGLGFFDGDFIYDLECPPSSGLVTAVLALGHDEVVVGTSHGDAYHYSRPANNFSEEVFQDDQLQAVEDITRDAFNRVWIARKEAYRFDMGGTPSEPGNWTRDVLGAVEGLNGDKLRVVFESSAFEGTAMTPIGTREVWFGSDIGIAVLTGFPWTNFNAADDALVCAPDIFPIVRCNTVGHVVIDPTRDAIWFGAQYGLSRLNDDGSWDGWANGIPEGTPSGLLHNSIHALHLDDDGLLWVSSGTDTARALQYRDVGGASWETVGQGAERWRISDMARDAQGFLWLAAADGAWRLDTATVPFGETLFAASDGVPAGALQALTTVQNDVFVASAAGIGRFEQASSLWTLWPLSDLPGAGPWTFRDLHVKQDTLYAATDGGLIVVPRSAMSLAEATVLSAESLILGSFATNLYDVEDGGDGTLLIAADSGLYRLAAGLGRSGRMDVRDGLPDTNVLAVVKHGDEVWIGTEGDGAAGHVFEPPETVIADTLGPVLSSTSPVLVRVEGNDLDSPLDLLRFQLRVDDGAWSEPQPGRFLTFVPAELGLADGEHVLSVRAVDNGLLFDATPAATIFQLDTTPPIARITVPVEGQALRGAVEIIGTADDVDDRRFESYLVGVRRGDASSPLEVIQPWTGTRVVDSVIATWDTGPFPDDWYTLEVVVRDLFGVNGTLRLDVLVDNVAPFADVTSPMLVHGDRGATIYSVAGDASVTFPPFAFDGEHTITIDVEPDPESHAGRRFVLGPANLTLRKNPTLELQADGAAADLAVHRGDGDTWIRVGGTRFERSEGTFYAASIDRLGVYALRSSTARAGGAVISELRAEPRHFRPRTSALDRLAVSFVLGRPARVSAMVYNRAGRPRRMLAEALEMGIGEQVLYWDGRDDGGQLVASALYIVCIEADGERVTKVVTVGAD